MTVQEIYKEMSYGSAPESGQMANDWLDQHQRKFKLYIDGSWRAPSSRKYFPSANPSNEDHLADIAFANKTDVNKAVQAANKAFKSWSNLSGHERAKYLYALARQIQKHARLFAVLEALDNGKPIRETRDIDIPLVVRHFYHHAGWAQILDQEFVGYKSIGVVGQIIPWNFPLLMLSWKIAPALAAGNTIVLKPAEFTSLTALLFGEICERVGLPNGVVNIVTGDGATGAALVENTDVDKIAFTGSTEVGRIIRKATAGTGKKISLELGGKSPFIVFEDADLDSVVEGVVDAIWFNQGQVCCAGSRLLVQESIAPKLYKKIRRRMEKLRIGDALDKGIDMGAIVAPVQLKTIEGLVQKGVDEGCTLWQPSWAKPKKGNFYPPSLFTEVAPSATIAQEEIFGPVLVAMTFRSHKEAVKLANNTRYGLAASIWTENINLALDIAPQLKAGTVWVNSTNVFDAASGFGGYRESGFGREGGKEGMYEYLKFDFDGVTFSKSIYDSGKIKPSQSNFTAIDRTPKMYIGGSQKRPDGGYSMAVKDAYGNPIGEVPQGNRKDIRNAVEAAHACKKWSAMTGHQKAQVLYFIAENLNARYDEFVSRLGSSACLSADYARAEVQESIQRIFTYAAWADKYDGLVHHTSSRNVTLAMPEPIGVMGLICPKDFPLLGLVSTLFPLLAMGNRVVMVPSDEYPLIATDLYQVFDTSDLPGGAVNIITGKSDELAHVLALHDDVDGIWFWGDKDGAANIESSASANMKRTWVNHGLYHDWMKKGPNEGREFLRRASEVKNIWIPYGA